LVVAGIGHAGAMTFGQWGNPDHEDLVRIIHRALAAGITFIDTADVYSAGESEQIVGKALVGGKRAYVVLATKVHGGMDSDRIDLYQIHRPWVPRHGARTTIYLLLDVHSNRPHPLTAPAVSPSTNQRCTSAKRITTGMMMITVPAAIWPHCRISD
jgi:aryl-alcohol dehydrogenase-like predicted oxidoreductase